MKNILKLAVLFICMSFCSNVFAAQKSTVAILSDNIHAPNNTYFIYPEFAQMLSQDIANSIIKTGKIKPLQPSENARILNNSVARPDIIRLLDEYKMTLNIDFITLKKIATILHTDTILLVTSGTDYQSDFLRFTFWNFINWPGADVVHPKHIITSNITLVDPNSEVILMQKIFRQKIPAKDFDLAITRFSPPDSQLSKLKPYSVNLASYLSEEIAYKVMNRNSYLELDIPQMFQGNFLVNGRHINLHETRLKYNKITNADERAQKRAIKKANNKKLKEQKKLAKKEIKIINKNKKRIFMRNTQEIDLTPKYVDDNSKNYIYEEL